MPPTVLLLDCDVRCASACERWLESDGFQVLRAADAAGAMSLIKRQHPDLVVMETVLGSDSGVEYLPRLMQMEPRLHVILYTRFGFYRDDFNSWLADAYVVKSDDPAPLLNAVHRSLDSAK